MLQVRIGSIQRRLLVVAILAAFPCAADELKTLDVVRYGVQCQIPDAWRVVVEGEEAMVFGVTIPTGNETMPAALKCEIGTAPESLDEYRWRIDRRAEQNKGRRLKLKENALAKGKHGEQLVTLWNYDSPATGAIFDLELRVISHGQIYTFTLRSPGTQFEELRPRLREVVDSTEFTAPKTGLVIAQDGRCMQEKHGFGIHLPKGWKPAFPLSSRTLFWASSVPSGIWNDSLLVVANKAKTLDLDLLIKQMPENLKREDPTCEIKSCRRVPQGKGFAVETVVETKRGPFSITVLERRYAGRRFNYEIKFTVQSKTFEQRTDEFRKCADSFIELISPEDLKKNAT